MPALGTIMLITLFIRRLARGLWPVSDLQPRVSIATIYVNMEDEVQCVDFVELPIVQSQATSTTTSSTSILDKLKVPSKSDLARKRRVELPKTTAANKKHKAGLLCLQQLFIMPGINIAASSTF